MARHKEFDRDLALNSALGLFWERGYASTSTEALLARMQISRQSLYDTFGDKKQLYLEALKAYTGKSTADAMRSLNKPESPLEGIEAMLSSLAATAAKGKGLGCMGVNAVCEFGSSEPGVMEATADAGGQLIAAIEARLQQAKSRGEVSDSLNVAAGAMFVNLVMNGIQVSAKGGASKPALNAMVGLALDGIRRRP